MITLLLVAAMLAPQGNITIRRGTPVPAGDIDVRCFLTWETLPSPATADYTIGAGECCGDSVLQSDSDAYITTSPVNIETYAGRYPSNNDHHSIDPVDDTDPFDVSSGRVGFWFYMTTAPTTAPTTVFRAHQNQAVPDSLEIQVDQNNDLIIEWNIDTASESTCTATASTLSTGVWYFVQGRWVTDTASDDELEVYWQTGASQSSFSCTGLSLTEITGLDVIELGTATGTDAVDFSVDTFMLSNDPTRDFGPDRNFTDESSYSNSCN